MEAFNEVTILTNKRCPVQGCGMPMSIVGGHKGSYRKTNPQLAQTVESLKIICDNLKRSPDQWWESESVSTLVKSTSQADPNDPLDEKTGKKNEEGSDEEEMVDLQGYESPVVEESSIGNEGNEDEDSDWD
jgi:hypothetical protein